MRRFLPLLALLSACGNEYTVRVGFESPALRAEVVRVEVAVVESCPAAHSDGPINAIARVEVALDEAAPALGEFEPGTYGLVARAWNARCEVVAYSCRITVVEGGGDGVLSVTLAAQTGQRCAADETCAAAICSGGTDANVPDADTPDADTPDIDLPDTPVDGPGDAGPDAAAECIGAANGTTCAVSLGQCFQGACCTGCINAGSCELGTAAAACGTEGGACTACDSDGPRCREGMCTAPRTIERVIVGVDTTHAIDSDGQAWVWGGTDESATGREGVSAAPMPMDFDGRVVDLQVNRLTHTDIADSSTRSGCLLDDEGQVHCWGYLWVGPATVRIPITHFPFGERFEAMVLTANTSNEQPRVFASTADGTTYRLGYELCGSMRVTDWIMEAEGESGTTEVDGGATHVCVINMGDLYCAGSDPSSERFIGTLSADGCVQSPALYSGVIGVATGRTHTCAIRFDRTVACFGSNDFGQLGVAPSGSLAFDRADPSANLPDGFTRLAAGSVHTCGIHGGQVRCWGCGTYGRVGDETNDTSLCSEMSNEIVRLPDGAVAVSVDAGSNHSCAVDDEGQAFCWGRDIAGSVSAGLPGYVPGAVVAISLP